jgi:regulatory protein
MQITRIEPFEGSRKAWGHGSKTSGLLKIYLDGVYAFPLSDGDIEEYGLEEGMELPEEKHQELLWEVVYSRAKQKALNLLKFHDRTEAELTRRLKEEGYPEQILPKLFQYLSEYGYLNDARYAANYIRSRITLKSKLVITEELTAKGIGKDIIRDIFRTEYEELKEDPELFAIRKAIRKKVRDVSLLNREEKQRLMAYLYRKGFTTGNIRKVMEENREMAD